MRPTPFLTCLLVLLATASLSSAATPAPATPRPNVVLIITDDLGYGDLACYGATDIRTPHLDELALQGVRLTDFYANAPVCSPTRAALISGRYQQRAPLEHPLGGPRSSSGKVGLTATATSLPNLLKENGYATALMGKWHLGYKPEFSPGAHGFDTFFGFKSGYVDYYTHTGGDGRPDLWENDEQVEVPGYLTDLITDRSVSFIRDHAGEPFFLEVAYNAAHWPYQPPDQPSQARDNARHLRSYDDSTSSRADYAAMVERADEGVGRILSVLDDLDLTQNTLVIFTNDNGGEWLSRNTPFFHRKWTLWEGGIRVPTIVRWPGHIPEGRVSDQVGITMDLTASILAATRTPVPADAAFDGMDLLPILSGNESTVDRTLYWRSMWGRRKMMAVRSGDWKLVLDGRAAMLFDVGTDPGERDDLAGRRTDLAGQLRKRLAAWEEDVDAGKPPLKPGGRRSGILSGTVVFQRTAGEESGAQATRPEPSPWVGARITLWRYRGADEAPGQWAGQTVTNKQGDFELELAPGQYLGALHDDSGELGPVAADACQGRYPTQQAVADCRVVTVRAGERSRVAFIAFPGEQR